MRMRQSLKPDEESSEMDRTDCAYLINTTPKYFYLLHLHITLLHRYAPSLAWPVYIATEAPERLDPLPKGVTVLTLPKTKAGFFESREAAVAMLPDTIKYVFPIQEDFLLEARPMEKEIAEALQILDADPQVMSLRLMPCPGPNALDVSYKTVGPWKILDFDAEMVFTYQATVWRRAAYQTFMAALLHKTEHLDERQKIVAAIKVNIAEIAEGQMLLQRSLNQGHSEGQKEVLHLAYPRAYQHPNAVYLCPWPYRPTAVVRGILEPWAAELAQRESVPL
jgi:hypothetical protein